MPATQIAAPPAPNLRTEELAREIAIDCDRALRRLDRLNRERDDVMLVHARAFIRHAATLSHAIECGRLGRVA
jgi:CMP-N-acetylneuraminic acid synthetase